MNKRFYLMESESEGYRLKTKTDVDRTYEDLLKVGFNKIKNDSVIVDAGAGVGIVSRLMADMLRKERKKGQICLLDFSKKRLGYAKRIVKKRGCKNKFSFVVCDLENIPYKDNSVDFVFCRFIFEYLKDPELVFNEFYRILKPGGKIVVGDLDLNCLCHYPSENKIDKMLLKFAKELYKKKYFDVYAGRKLYWYYYKANMKQVKIHVSAHNVFYGKLKEKDKYNWKMKIKQLINIQKKENIKIGVKLKNYKEELENYIAEAPFRFSYTPYILVEGVK